MKYDQINKLDDEKFHRLTSVKHTTFYKLSKIENAYEVVLINATETPIERPKKDKSIFILAKRSDIH